MNVQTGTLVVITGPTAVGKTELALSLTPRLEAEIISADSRQVYRYLDVGTGKPTPPQRAAAPHHGVDVAYPDRPYSIAEYRRAAERALNDVWARGRLPLVVGGSPHYLVALVDRFDVPPTDAPLRAWLGRADRAHPGQLDPWLAALDPTSAATIDPRNRRRVLRALEVTLLTGQPFARAGRRRQAALPALWLGLRLDRPALYARVAKRASAMVAAGWLEEVRMLLAMGYSLDLPALSATGYGELAGVLRGQQSLERAVERICQATHAFIRRQEIWFRKEPRIQWLDAAEPDLVGRAMAALEALGHNQPGVP